MDQQTKKFRLYQASNLSDESQSKKNLEDLESKTLKFINNQQYEEAIRALKQAQSKTQNGDNQVGTTDRDTILAIIHNLAVCYEKTGRLADCLYYIDACIYNMSISRFNRHLIQKSSNRIRKNKYICRLALSAADKFQKLGKYKSALKKARLGYQHSLNSLQSTCQSLKGQNSDYNALSTHKLKIAERVYPTALSIQRYIKKNVLPKNAPLRSALGVIGYPQWAYEVNLEDILQLNPHSAEDFKIGKGIHAEFSHDYLLYKILLLAVSLYMVGSLSKSHTNIKKSIRLIKSYFPKESPLLRTIRSKKIDFYQVRRLKKNRAKSVCSIIKKSFKSSRRHKPVKKFYNHSFELGRKSRNEK